MNREPNEGPHYTPVSELMRRDMDKADDALNGIEECAKHFGEHIAYLVKTHDLHIKSSDLREAIGAINDIVDDLFHAERIRLMDVAGWRKGYTQNPDAIQSLFDILKDSLRPVPCNPATKSNGESA